MRRRISPWAALWLLLGALYFLVPLAATAQISFKTGRDEYSLDAYRGILEDPGFLSSLSFSFKMSLFTIAIAIVLLVPTAYWVRLKLPRLAPVMDFLTILPFVVPPIVLVVGLLRTYQQTPEWFVGSSPILVAGYVILAFPYVYRALDSGLRAIDVHTLTEAAQSLGAGWGTTLLRIILPNLRAALLAAAFLTLAIVMGEYTLAGLMLFDAFSVYIAYVGETQATGASALTIISFAITWMAMLGILLVGRRVGRGQVQMGGTR